MVRRENLRRRWSMRVLVGWAFVRTVHETGIRRRRLELGDLMSAHKTSVVGSHLGPINVAGENVPIGFLASHRKKHHLPCKATNGFIVMKTKAGPVNHVCPCAVGRAIKKLRQVKMKAWLQLAGEWLEAEKARLAEDEKRCEQEGYEAPVDATCPYPEKTDQELWWNAGRARAGHDRQAQVELEHAQEIQEASEEGDPFAEGADTALAGGSETANPYDPSDDRHLSWNDGFASVREDETERRRA